MSDKKIIGSVDFFTEDLLKKRLPKNIHRHVNSQLVDLFNNAVADCINTEDAPLETAYADMLKENLIGWASALDSLGTAPKESYVDAVKFVSYTNMGLNYTQAYVATHPDRASRLINEGRMSQINQYASMFANTAIVQSVTTASGLSDRLLLKTSKAMALSKLISLMENSKNEYVVQKCASAILAVPAPEEKAELNVNVNHSVEVEDVIVKKLNDMANQQLENISKGQLDLRELGKVKENG